MHTNGMEPSPPIPWPHIQIDGVDIELKYSMGLFYRASQRGISIGDLADKAKNFAVIMDLIAIIAEPALRELKRPVLTAEEWADKLSDMNQFVEIARAFNEAYQLSIKTRPAAAPTGETATQGQIQ